MNFGVSWNICTSWVTLIFSRRTLLHAVCSDEGVPIKYVESSLYIFLDSPFFVHFERASTFWSHLSTSGGTPIIIFIIEFSCNPFYFLIGTWIQIFNKFTLYCIYWSLCKVWYNFFQIKTKWLNFSMYNSVQIFWKADQFFKKVDKIDMTIA
jgi:hypothetical protein